MKKAAHGRNKCDSCDFETYYRTSLKNHVKAVYRDTGKFACRICDYTSYYKHNLRCHIKSNHPKSQSRNFRRIGCTPCELDKVHLKCVVSGSVTRIRRKVLNSKTTIDIEEEENPLRCEECEYYATRTDLLQNHIKSVHKKS